MRGVIAQRESNIRFSKLNTRSFLIFIVMELQFYKAEIDPNPTSDLEVNFIGLVDRPAIERNFQAFRAHPNNDVIQLLVAKSEAFKNHAKFTLNEEKRIISGPAMIADLPLYRKDDQLGEYYVIFDKQTIRTIMTKFHSKGYMQNFNMFHNENQKVEGVTIFNSFQSDAELGIMPLKGFEDVADGSWFVSSKVDNEQVWNDVKTGKIKGFSVEGLFTYVPMVKPKLTVDEAASRIQQILSETNFD